MAGAPTVPVSAKIVPSASPALPAAQLYAAHVAAAAQQYGISENWIRAVMRAESGGDPRAVSRAGAMGLMQLMPATWAAMTARHGLGSDPFDPRANILAGTAYLREMLDRFSDPAAVLAAYNAGPRRADDWLTKRRPLPLETIAYVARIAPAIGISTIAMAGSPSAVPPRDWRLAALFTARPSTASDAPATTADTPSTENSTSARATVSLHGGQPSGGDPTAAEPQKPSLFVVLSGPRS